MSVVYFILTFILNASANILLKLGAKKGLQYHGLNFPELLDQNYLVLLGLGSFALSAFFYFLSLRSLSISIAYPLMVGSSFVLINIYAVLFLGESINWQQLFGFACLLLGMVIIFYFSHQRY
jgi:multidrug transporter EmrE-like cation transporter